MKNIFYSPAKIKIIIKKCLIIAVVLTTKPILFHLHSPVSGKIGGAPLDTAPSSASGTADKSPSPAEEHPPTPDTAKSSTASETKLKNRAAMEKRQDSRKISRLLLGELHRDKEYLENLLKNPSE